MFDTLEKKYIHVFDVQERYRSDLLFSDSTKIRMYADDIRLGVRLKGTYNKWAEKYQYPTDDNITVELPQWEPDAVRGWLGFEEISTKPDDTTINWRISDGTSQYYWDGLNWVIASLSTHWNTEIEVSGNISSFAFTQKKIKFIAKLKTTDKFATPILLGYRLLMKADFDWFEDLIARSLVPRMREDFTLIYDWSGVLDQTTDRFNVKTDENFIPEENVNIVDIKEVWNDDTDPNHYTNILSSFNSSTGEIILTGSISSGTRLYYRLVVEPEIVINFNNTDYTELGATPTIVLNALEIRGQQIKATIDMAMKDRDEGAKLDSPLWVKELRISCTVLTGKITNSLRYISQMYGFIIRGETQRSNHKIGPILKTKALDLEHTLKFLGVSRYSPKPNLSDLKESTFMISIRDFYVWLRDLETKDVVSTFNYAIEDMAEVGSGPVPSSGTIEQLPAGKIPFL
jgi:hypothetical protein